jgi:hypothetical protein
MLKKSSYVGYYFFADWYHIAKKLIKTNFHHKTTAQPPHLHKPPIYRIIPPQRRFEKQLAGAAALLTAKHG